ncbi:MAG: glycosyltransferase [Verrucomicrobia bacterium]|nr:glycosyltransferase [Verrucomicrobiota bacterium]
MDEELRAAEAHIARLEQELLRLKDVKRELQTLRAEHDALRRSFAGRIATLLRRKKKAAHEPSEYERWFARHRTQENEITELRDRARAYSYSPLVSVLMPAFNSHDKFLAAAIESVRNQIYENWELIIVDDGSPKPSKLLRRASDSRIKVFLEKHHGGISAALNVALSHARGDWIALLDHDDLLEPDALFRGIELLQSDRFADLVYSDEDKIVDEHFAAPMFKPDWSPDFFLTHDYLGHFVLIRREFVDEFRSEFDGAQDYDLLLRIAERTRRIRHIPRVLYHWRRTPESTAHNIRHKPGALEAGRSAIEQHLRRRGIDGRVTIDWETHAYRVRRDVATPKVTIVMLDANPEQAGLIRERTAYTNLEIVTKPAALLDVESELLVFLEGGLVPVAQDWLALLLEYAAPEKIGAVAPRILNADGLVESAGLILLPGGRIRRAFAGSARDFRGANRQLQMVRNYSAIAPACLVTRRDLLQKLAFPSAAGLLEFARNRDLCTSVEFCLKLRDAGLRIVSVPYAELRRSTSPPGETTASCPELAKRWPEMFARDPFYNPNLSRERADFSLDEARA